MGLLDEAIREHLELKRRRGADPGDIARQEREALGPARRQAEEAAAPADELGVAAPAPAAEEWDDAPEVDTVQPELEDAIDETAGDEAWEDDVDEPSTESLEPASDAATVAPPPPADTGQPTSEYDVLAGDPAESAAEEREYRRPEPDDADEDEEDVLEETPEFLQETPEHDRLWFEQRPPRDFDFDG
jgi:hypothetical protein